MSTGRSIHTTGEHTIDNIVRSEYGDLPPDEHVAKKKVLQSLNPHITSLESLRVGDQVFLEEESVPEEEAPQEEEEQQPELTPVEEDKQPELTPDIHLENPPDDNLDGTIHVPAIEKKRKHKE